MIMRLASTLNMSHRELEMELKSSVQGRDLFVHTAIITQHAVLTYISMVRLAAQVSDPEEGTLLTRSVLNLLDNAY